MFVELDPWPKVASDSDLRRYRVLKLGQKNCEYQMPMQENNILKLPQISNFKLCCEVEELLDKN